MNRVAQKTINKEKVVCMTLATICVALLGLYMYLVSASVWHVVMRTEISQEITALSSEISELEGQYIEAQHRVSSDIASLQGYSQASQKVFIDRSAGSLVLKTEINR